MCFTVLHFLSLPDFLLSNFVSLICFIALRRLIRFWYIALWNVILMRELRAIHIINRPISPRICNLLFVKSGRARLCLKSISRAKAVSPKADYLKKPMMFCHMKSKI